MSHLIEQDSQEPEGGEKPNRAIVVYHRIDGAIFAVEAAVVTAATVLMTAFVFMNLMFEFANGQSLKMAALAESGELWTISAWTSQLLPTPAIGLAIFFLVDAALRAQPGKEKRPLLWRLCLSVLLVLALFGLVLMMLKMHPRWPCLTLVAIGMVHSGLWLRGRLKEGELSPQILAIWVIIFALLIPLVITLPDAYSTWQSYALFLLLWAAFIGASMATSRGRHLKIDAVRKAVPERISGIYDFLSYMTAAIFSAAFCYLAFTYTLVRMASDTVVGEIPDWLKVLAIPIALLFITIRFAARAILALMGERTQGGEEFVLPSPEETEAKG